VDRDILPEEFGGTAGPFENASCQEAIAEFEEYYGEVRKMAEENKGKY
jgi:hypothetical protein